VDFKKQTILCDGVAWSDESDPDVFEVPYSKLIIAAGVKTNTFNTPMIEEREEKEVFFLKHLHHARGIRDRTIEMFESAALPLTSDNEKRRLLSFLVVGGGPTSCEYTAELHDFLEEDLVRLYPELIPFVKITLVEAGNTLLGPFDKTLRDYVVTLFTKRNIEVKLETAVKALELYRDDDFKHQGTRAVLSNGEKLPFGLMVWSAGLRPVRFTQQLDPAIKSKSGRILTDKFLRVQHQEGKVWAIGDCAEIEGNALPQLAQVAQQQARYVSKVLSGKQEIDEKEFHFFSLGSMAQLGTGKGIFDGTGVLGSWFKFSGFAAWITWRSAYWGKQISWANTLLIPMYWFKAFVFGRDISRF
jgi:NADH dehydrogenase/NADH:ubiquinone reductase (non-electrogenic)